MDSQLKDKAMDATNELCSFNVPPTSMDEAEAMLRSSAYRHRFEEIFAEDETDAIVREVRLRNIKW